MSATGTYAIQHGRVVKVSDEIPTIQRPVHFNAGGLPYFDKSARRWFNSKTEKRSWLKRNKLREGGIINPDKDF